MVWQWQWSIVGGGLIGFIKYSDEYDLPLVAARVSAFVTFLGVCVR